MNVLPLVNKGLALFQWRQDAEAAERCLYEAMRTDPDCEAAVATLAQLSLQQGKIDVAVNMFERHSELARSELELVNALTYQYVRKIHPIMAERVWTDHDDALLSPLVGIVCSTEVYQELP
jgi:lipopolysaccharide biosynthesis regulator YciM